MLAVCAMILMCATPAVGQLSPTAGLIGATLAGVFALGALSTARQ